jgi:hypothetical protein
MTGHRNIETQAAPNRQYLPPKGPTDTQTAWEDPWSATARTFRELADTDTPFGRGRVLPDASTIGRRITEEINADPAEVARLRRARRNARAGKTYPRHSDTN